MPKPANRTGFWLETDNHKACEIARLAGYDVVVFDMEHGSLDENCLDRLIPFCNGLGLMTYVRVSDAAQPRIQIALDMGAGGVIVPQIRDLAHARQSAAFAKYPPRGARGLGYSRTQNYGAPSDSFIAKENDTKKCLMMIESVGALRDAKAIAALDCVDGLFVGPADLSLARGRGVFSASKEDMADLASVAKAAKSSGKIWGAAASHPAYRKRAIRLGADFVTAADDLSAMVAGFKQLLD
jgi:2-dehydro-3-deoxyglucarate aldolase/4-hydroxy-2-oxoheptanedioate aldolase